jgi:cytochrome c-type biogenesis protein CcmE
MKTIHIVIIIVVVVAIAVVISTLTDSNTYADFGKAANNPGKEYHIIGKLNRQKAISYDPQNNPNQFSFYMTDEDGVEKKVVYNNAKPQDFEKSEKVVIVGKMKGDEFIASSMLLKCPSKYNDNKTPQKFGEKSFGNAS